MRRECCSPPTDRMRRTQPCWQESCDQRLGSEIPSVRRRLGELTTRPRNTIQCICSPFAGRDPPGGAPTVMKSHPSILGRDRDTAGQRIVFRAVLRCVPNGHSCLQIRTDSMQPSLTLDRQVHNRHLQTQFEPRTTGWLNPKRQCLWKAGYVRLKRKCVLARKSRLQPRKPISPGEW